LRGPGVVIAPAPVITNPAAPGGVGAGDPRAGFPCSGTWFGGTCYASMGEQIDVSDLPNAANDSAYDEKCKGPGGGDDDCRKASPWHLEQLGIFDAHAFKQEFVLGSLSKYDICICKDGTVKLKAAGKCGKPGPSIETGMTMPK